MNFLVKTKGHNDFIDITDKVAKAVEKSDAKDGVAAVFVKATTAAITIMEFEKGLIEDVKDALEKIAPENFNYKHHAAWNDKNGAAHIKSALIGTNLTLPIANGKLNLGTWQRIVVMDFDERPREREIVVSVLQ